MVVRGKVSFKLSYKGPILCSIVCAVCAQKTCHSRLYKSVFCCLFKGDKGSQSTVPMNYIFRNCQAGSFIHKDRWVVQVERRGQHQNTSL